MRITKKNQNIKPNNNSNIAFENNINLDISDKIKNIDNELKKINLIINKYESDINNKLSNNEYQTILKEINNLFSRIDFKLNDIMNILNCKGNKLFKIEKNEKKSNNKMLGTENIKKFDIINCKIKRIEGLEIIQNYRKKSYYIPKIQLPKVIKPLIRQNVYSISIYNGCLEGHEDIIMKEEDELLRLLLPIPEFIIEEKDNFLIFSLEKHPLNIQFNTRIEYKSQK